MKKCESYDEYVRERSATAFEKGVHFGRTGKMIEKVTETVSRCRGTKECEPCECGGDRRKCDFYPENRLPENVAKYEKEHAPKFGKWISVEDRLPKSCYLVLIAFAPSKGEVRKGLIVNTGYINSDGNWFECHSPLPICRWKDITHWMPLPEPPKESED